MQINELTINEKFYLAAYLVYDKSIPKADAYMQNIVTKTTLSKIRKHLIELDYLEYKDLSSTNIQIAKRLTIENSHKGLICEWCNKESYILQEHHYPISRKNGGKNIVRICPNCHYTFHKIISENYYKED